MLNCRNTGERDKYPRIITLMQTRSNKQYFTNYRCFWVIFISTSYLRIRGHTSNEFEFKTLLKLQYTNLVESGFYRHSILIFLLIYNA